MSYILEGHKAVNRFFMICMNTPTDRRLHIKRWANGQLQYDVQADPSVGAAIASPFSNGVVAKITHIKSLPPP